MKYSFHTISVFILVFTFFLSGCFGPKKGLYPPHEESKDNVTVYVSKRSWHTGIVMDRSDIDTLLPVLTRNIPKAKYINLSWGDRKYFMAEEGTVGLALRAALLPTKSVIHVIGYTHLPEWYVKQKQVVEVELSREGFISMADYIHDSFARDSVGYLVPLRERPVGMSYFYLSDITYWGTRTCNVWTAKALRKSGFPINPFIALTSANVMKQVRRKQ